MSAQLFQKYLKDALGIAETRIPDLAEGVDKLHSALCQMDSENLGKIQAMGLEVLLMKFALVEKLRDVLSYKNTLPFKTKGV